MTVNPAIAAKLRIEDRELALVADGCPGRVGTPGQLNLEMIS